LVVPLAGCGGEEPAAKPEGPPPEAKKLADGRYEVPRVWLKDSKPWYGENAMRDFAAVADPNGTGVRISGFHAGSRADKMGLEDGDLLRVIDGKPVDDVQRAVRALDGLSEKDTATLELTRKGQPITLIFEIK
jgi:S1-C subfamily serine protease